MLLLGEEEIQGLVSMRECIDLMRSAYAELAAGQARITPRGRIRLNYDGPASKRWSLNTMAGAIPSLGVAAVRIDSIAYADSASTQRAGGRYVDDRFSGLVLLFDLGTGRLIAVLPGFTISGLRVAATSALVVDLSAPQGPASLGVFGSGKQARSHVAAMAAVRTITRVLVFSPDPDHVRAFCAEIASVHGLRAVAATAQAVVEGSDVIVITTNAKAAVFDGRWLPERCCVVSTGNADRYQDRRGVDSATIERADLVIVNSREMADLDRQVDVLDAIAHAEREGRSLMEVKDLVAAGGATWTQREGVTLYCNNGGQGIQVTAIAEIMYRRALRSGSGRELPASWFSTNLSTWTARGLSPSS